LCSRRWCRRQQWIGLLRGELMAGSATEYLNQARACAKLAEHMKPEDKERMLAVAESWLKLAEAAAKEAEKSELQSTRQKTG
jgi:hypothetical protein